MCCNGFLKQLLDFPPPGICGEAGKVNVVQGQRSPRPGGDAQWCPLEGWPWIRAEFMLGTTP